MQASRSSCDITVQGTTPKNSSIEVQHWTDGDGQFAATFIHSSITAPSFDIFISAASGVLLMGMYFLIAASFACTASSLSFMRPMRPEDLGEVERLDGDARALQQLLGVAHGVEGRGPRADRADAHVA